MPSSPAYCLRGWSLHPRPRHGCLVSGLHSPPLLLNIPTPPLAQVYGLLYTEASTWGTADMWYYSFKDMALYVLKSKMVALIIMPIFWLLHRGHACAIIQPIVKTKYLNFTCSHISSISPAWAFPSFFLKTCMYTMNDPVTLHITTLFTYVLPLLFNVFSQFTNILFVSAQLQDEIPKLWLFHLFPCSRVVISLWCWALLLSMGKWSHSLPTLSASNVGREAFSAKTQMICV